MRGILRRRLWYATRIACFVACRVMGCVVWCGVCAQWSGAGDDLLLRVPLALRLPASLGGVGGGKVEYPVQLLDMFPTLCELAGVPINDSIYVQFGRSLVPQACAWEGA